MDGVTGQTKYVRYLASSIDTSTGSEQSFWELENNIRLVVFVKTNKLYSIYDVQNTVRFF